LNPQEDIVSPVSERKKAVQADPADTPEGLGAVGLRLRYSV